ncbi:MAG TPA: UDP-N-acetylmuramoyl-L-alanyl-D-glutamate--2,6-diaminopimelate ligase [Rhodocyclaceae bacterium]|nr:UDP-N-acetylmuramoyl-L-alanyl-D-glutamate--2,6-diaminopimelate ligase [Rhodocyclaceae bacterium]
MTAADVVGWLSSQGVQVTGISADSRRIDAGDVFVALPGLRSDGRAHIAEAVAKGAVAVLTVVRELGDVGVPALAVADLPALSGEIAHLLYGRPSERLWLAGVTGTNGKTSVSQWIAQAMTLLDRKCGVIGTLGNGFPGELRASPNTTPDAVTLHRTLAGFLAKGAVACAMEVSSIGIDLKRIAGAAFDVAVFTNLSRDHLDHHGTMEAYAAAKASFFELPGLSAAVINLDDPFGLELARALKGRLRVIGYSLGGAPADAADELLAAANFAMTGAGLGFELAGVRFEAPVVGRFNAANLLAVIGGLVAGGKGLADIAAALRHIEPPPGRMQALGGKDRPLVVVDYAHTPDALEKVLATLRETAAARRGRLVCVFGCGGDRDPGKRPLMGEAAERLADRVILTSDNPRGEEPAAIIAAIAAGMSNPPVIEADRAAAIRRAVGEAAAADVVLLAGKGHEPYQEVAGVRRPFSDAQEALLALKAREARP